MRQIMYFLSVNSLLPVGTIYILILGKCKLNQRNGVGAVLKIPFAIFVGLVFTFSLSALGSVEDLCDPPCVFLKIFQLVQSNVHFVDYLCVPVFVFLVVFHQCVFLGFAFYSNNISP